MVGVAQLVEPRIVIPVVVGSIPIAHPIHGPLAQLVEQLTLNQLVVGSIPTRPINRINDLQGNFRGLSHLRGHFAYEQSTLTRNL